MKFAKFFVILICFFIITIYTSKCFSEEKKDIGFFIGSDSTNLERFLNYNEIVIDAHVFSHSDIEYLHNHNVKVYSYLNIGSIETYRPYYNEFLYLTLGNYENWPEEKWIDVSNKKWQEYLVNTLSKDLYEKGIDGLFLDNLDVYSLYKSENIFQGIYSIINSLNKIYNKPIIANGGYEFFTEAMNRTIDLSSLVYGVNKESVYTYIDFDRQKFRINSKEERTFVLDYLAELKSNDVNIYVLEYSRKRKTNKKIVSFYKNLGYKCYVSPSIDLK